MRVPRDLRNYLPASESASFLRRKAAEIEASAREAPLVKVVVEVWNWNPRWRDPAKAPHLLSVSVGPR